MVKRISCSRQTLKSSAFLKFFTSRSEGPPERIELHRIPGRMQQDIIGSTKNIQHHRAYKDAYDPKFFRAQGVFVNQPYGNLRYPCPIMKGHHREYIVYSGAPLHMMGRSSSTSEQLKTIRPAKKVDLIHPNSEWNHRCKPTSGGTRQRLEHVPHRHTGRGFASSVLFRN